jgi:hypothetical protein
MDHRRHVERDHRLVEGMPESVGERRRGEMASAWVRVEIAADETEFGDAALEFRDRSSHVGAGALRQHAGADERIRVQSADAADEIIRMAGPDLRHLLVADMRRHRGGARRKNRHVGAALSDQAELVGLDSFANLVIGDRGIGREWLARLECNLLPIAPGVVFGGRGRVVTVTIDDQRHAGGPFVLESSRAASFARRPFGGCNARSPMAR